MCILCSRDCVQGILDEADVDGDGQINYTEFYDLMSNNNWLSFRFLLQIFFLIEILQILSS